MSFKRQRRLFHLADLVLEARAALSKPVTKSMLDLNPTAHLYRVVFPLPVPNKPAPPPLNRRKSTMRDIQAAEAIVNGPYAGILAMPILRTKGLVFAAIPWPRSSMFTILTLKVLKHFLCPWLCC